MKLEKVYILLPCHTLEDLELSCPSREADELLTAWCAPFHPSVLAEIKETPKWEPAESPPESIDRETAVLIPSKSEVFLPDGWLEEAASKGAAVIRCEGGLDATASRILEVVPQERKPDHLSDDTVADFFSLALCQIQVELITRRMHYMSGLDEDRFQSEAVSAAEYAVKGETTTAREYLQAAFDMLTDARDYYHPSETRLLDLTIVAASTLGETFRAALDGPAATQLLVSGSTVARVAKTNPALLEKFKETLSREERPLAILGGEYSQRALPLLPPEAILAEFHKGLATYTTLLGKRPTVYARRRFGLTPFLPQLLEKLGFRGAIHATLDDGRFPTENQSKIEWHGFDGTGIDAVTRIPLDAGDPATFLSLPDSFGDVLDAAYSATVLFAHWPGGEHSWYDILRRANKFAPSLGEFLGIEKYFEEVAYTGHSSNYTADQYVSPYLRQWTAAKQPDSISRWARYYRLRTLLDAVMTYDALYQVVRGRPDGPSRADWVDGVESIAEGEAEDVSEEDLVRELRAAAGRCADLLGGTEGEGDGVLAVSPWSFSGPAVVNVTALSKRPDVDGAVRVADESGGRKGAVVDVPGMGFAWVGPGGSREKAKAKRGSLFSWKKVKPRPKIVEENVLTNEYFQLTIDPDTGAIRSLNDFHTRGNRLAQQTALRLPASDPLCTPDDPESRYTIMAVDSIRVTKNGPITGEIITAGRLVNRHAKRLAGFTQTVRVRRGCRVFEIEVELDPDYAPVGNPWESYYAMRFAWADATVDVFRSVNGATVATDLARIESPYFVDIRGEKTRTTLLSGGLPFHRKFGLRKLDSLLAVAGETHRRFRMGVGIDLDDPLPAALEFLAPEARFARPNPAPANPTGWLFHLDAKNVVATRWEPLASADDPTRVDGVRVRLLETEGRECHCTLRTFRNVTAAAKTDFLGTPDETLSVQGDRITVPLSKHEWAQVEVRF